MVKVVCLGDSLTFGYGVSKKERWTELLKERADFKVINKGVNGDTTPGMLSRSFKDVIKNSPDYVIIMAGTNDLLMGRSLDRVEENVKSLCEEMLSHNITPVIGIQPPIIVRMAEKYWEPGIDYSAVNKNISEYRYWVKNNNESIRYADFYDVIKFRCDNGTDTDFYIDGLHLTSKGHELIADFAAAVLKEINI